MLFDGGAIILLLAFAMLALLTTNRLECAYKLYLRFPHPTATALASQIIVFLVAAIVITMCTERKHNDDRRVEPRVSSAAGLERDY